MMTCHSSRSVKHSPQTNLGSIRYPVGSTNGRPTLVRSFCSFALPPSLPASLFFLVARQFKRGHRFRVEEQRALRRLNSTLRLFRSWLLAETDSSLWLTRLA